MQDETVPMLTSIAVPGKSIPDLTEPIVIASEPNTLAIGIRDALLQEGKLGGADLEIRRSGDGVVISGDVRSEEQRELVLEIAGRYAGRDHVTDNITLLNEEGFFCEAWDIAFPRFVEEIFMCFRESSIDSCYEIHHPVFTTGNKPLYKCLNRDIIIANKLMQSAEINIPQIIFEVYRVSCPLIIYISTLAHHINT